MKKQLIILGLLIFTSSVFGYELALLQPSRYNYNSRAYYRPTYNPYSYNKNYNNAKRIQRINKLRKINKLKNNLNNLSWNLNRYNRGTLTGYSTPITSDVYKNMGLDFWDKEYIKTPSINYTTDIFTSPFGNNSIYNRGRIRNLNDGLSNRGGVKIIYD